MHLSFLLTVIFLIPDGALARQLHTTPSLRSASNLGCNQGNISSLTAWQQALMTGSSNTNSSLYGHLCFDTTQGSSNGQAQALWILGMKALSNFQYDLCKAVFDELMTIHPDFILGYWGAAMTLNQLLWSTEDPAQSLGLLKSGRTMQTKLGVILSAREELYYEAAEALNSPSQQGDNTTTALNFTCTHCRYSAFQRKCADLFKANPDDANAAAYALLSLQALGTVACTNIASGCQPHNEAQALALALFKDPIYRSNPAILHYSIHAFDSPVRTTYEAGLQFAEAYPEVVNGSTHSLHMPSHIFLRAGEFARASESDQGSVDASDAFNILVGAISSQGGPIGTSTFPAQPSGFGFAFDAGNTYHSLEFLQYEVLQGCDTGRAAGQVERMSVAAHQALVAVGAWQAVVGVAGNSTTPEVTSLGGPWYSSSTFLAWLYRMQARGSLQATLSSFIGGVGSLAETVGAIPSSWTLPLPLPWSGASDYGNQVNAPQSEAGLWSAIALERLIGKGSNLDRVIKEALQAAIESSNITVSNFTVNLTLPWEAPCLGPSGVSGPHPAAVPGMALCSDSIALMALQRIVQVQTHYASISMWFESNITQALAYEVRSAMALSAGDLQTAIHLAELAARSENEVALLPSSTSLSFIPGSAYKGALTMRVASAAGARSAAVRKISLSEAFKLRIPGLVDNTTAIDLLSEAVTSFEQCLEGHPNLPLCRLGAARSNALLKAEAKAKVHYKALLSTWGAFKGQPAQKDCQGAWREAKAAAH